jgi:hypothetical protein
MSTLGVFFLAVDSQRPEVRRRPGKDDQHQQQGVAIDLVGHGGPPQQRRRRSGQPANHDVLRCRALEVVGVDEGIPDQRGQGQPRRQRVDQQHQNKHAGASHRGSEHDRTDGAHAAACDGPVAGAGHLRIDAPIDEMIHCRSRACTQRDAEVAEHQHIPRHHAWRGQKHADDGCQHHERHDPGLAQLEVVAPGCFLRQGCFHDHQHKSGPWHCTQSAWPSGRSAYFFVGMLEQETQIGDRGPAVMGRQVVHHQKAARVHDEHRPIFDRSRIR